MKYGLARKIDVFDIELGEGDTFYAMPGAYLRAQLWASKHAKGAPEEVSAIYENYAWAWFGAQQAGLAEKYGMEGEPTRSAIDALAERTTIFIDAIPGGESPLRGAPSRKK